MHEEVSSPKKYLVLYYSKTGNSQFLAERIAEGLKADLRRLHPPISNLFFLYLLSSVKAGIGTGVSAKDLRPYDEIILLGPIWGGLVIAPLRNALRSCVKAGKPIHFAVSCELGDEEKDSKYGYSRVLQEARRIGGQNLRHAEAFPTTLVEDPEKPKTEGLSEKTRITDVNYKKDMQARVESFIQGIQKGVYS